MATHYPIFDRGLFFARLAMERDLAVGAPMDEAKAPKHAYWRVLTARERRALAVAPAFLKCYLLLSAASACCCCCWLPQLLSCFICQLQQQQASCLGT